MVAGCAAARVAGRLVVSFSHFLPRIELLPEKRFLFLPTLPKVIGAILLEDSPCNIIWTDARPLGGLQLQLPLRSLLQL